MNQFDYDIDDFLECCQCQNLRRKTLKSYEQTLRIFTRYMTDVMKVTDAKDTKELHIREYIKYLQSRGKYTVVGKDDNKTTNNPDSRSDFGQVISNTTINNYMRNIKVFYNYLYNNRLINNNPVSRVKSLKNEREPLEFITDLQFKRLIETFDLSKFHEYRDYIIFQLILDTGMRIGEALCIDVKNVDLQRKMIFLPAEDTKGNKSRYVFFSLEMFKLLKRWIAFKDRYLDSEFLFSTNRRGKLAVNNFEKNFRVYAKRSGLNDIHPHVLRNNFAKRLLMQGVIYTLSRILGHSSVTVTEKAYLDLDDEDLRQNYIQYSPLEHIKKNRI